MAINSKLHFDDKSYVIKKFSWGIHKQSNESGYVASRPILRKITMTIDAVGDTFFEEWAMASNLTKNLVIQLEHNILGAGIDLVISCGGLEFSNSTAVHSERWRKSFRDQGTPLTSQEEQELIFQSLHFEDEDKKKIDEKYNGKATLVLKTSNGTGKVIDIDLSSSEHNYKYKGEIVEDDILKDISITSDTVKLELEIIEE